jgi:prepilin-type N-terminal cleavage/methylation domain-containing protein
MAVGTDSSPTARARCGMTLLETVVVVAIVALLLSLTAAAVQRARESAARLRCLNNLKQVGLALQNYHSAEWHFPGF